MRIGLLILLLGCAACARNEPYMLYRGSVVDHSMREDLKRFDAGKYNRENCEITKGLYFGFYPGITQYYACEPIRTKS